MRRLTVLVVALLVASAVVPGIALGSVSGQPNIDVTASDTSFVAGEDGQLQLSVTNTGEIFGGNPQNPAAEQRVTTARGLTVSLDAGDAPLSVESGTVALGSIPDGGVAKPAFAISVDEDAEPGTYEVEAVVEYSYTEVVSERGLQGQVEQDVTKRIDVEVTVEEAADFAVVSVEEDLRVGERGTVAVTYENTGTAPARAATVTVTSSNAALTFGGAPSTETFLGDVAPGERRTVTLRARVAPGSETRSYALRSTLAYDDEDGVPQRQQLTAGVTPSSTARFTVVESETTATAGSSGTTVVRVRNTGEETLTDATVTVSSSNGAFTFGGAPTARTYVGEWAAGETRTLRFETSLAPSAEVRPYALDLTVGFENADGEAAQSVSLSTGVTPAAESRFTVTETDATVAVGGSGEVALALRNDAGRDLTDATVTVSSSNGAFTFGGAPTARTYVGEWAAGETQRLTFEAALAPTGERRPYALDVTVTFSEEGTAERTERLSTGVTPAAEQRFSLSDGAASLRVGEEGTLSGTLTNEGPDTVENAVLVLQPAGTNVDILEEEFAVGDLAVGESVAFEYDLDISSAAAGGPKQFTLRVEHEEDGATTRSDPLYTRVEVGDARDRFTVEPVENAFPAGNSGTLQLRVTNNGDDSVSSVSAKLFADSPVSASSDEAFVTELGPGDSAVIEFDVSVAEVATRTYPVSVDFQYEEPDGDTKLTDTYRVPVEVTAQEGGGGILSLSWLAGLLELVGGLLPGGLAFDRDVAMLGVLGLGLLVRPLRR